MPNDLIEDLDWRGLIADVSDRDELAKTLDEGRIGVYAGYDPTASSLHIGHLQVVVTLLMPSATKSDHKVSRSEALEAMAG